MATITAYTLYSVDPRGIKTILDSGLHTLQGCAESLWLDFQSNPESEEPLEWFVKSSDDKSYAVGELPQDLHDPNVLFELLQCPGP